jgi:diguanylate cyclase (GGDEF)-like protein/PAS domain S-box-containing protein
VSAGVALNNSKDRARTRVIVWGTTVTSLIVLVGVLFSVGDLYRALAQVRSIYSVDVKLLSLDGELQYQIQESRMRFLHLLLAATNLDERLRDIGEVRKADLQVSLLVGAATILTGAPSRLSRLETAWNEYGDIRDSMIALSLQERFAEARSMDRTAGVRAFDVASEAVRAGKRDLERSSAEKAEQVWAAMHRACLEILCLLVTSLAFVGGLLVTKLKQIGTVRELRSTAKTLSESEERFRNAFQEAAVGIVIMDLEGRIRSLNRAITEITGYGVDELVGRRVTFTMDDGYAQAVDGLLEQIRRGEISSYRAERQIAKRDGTFAWVRTSSSVLRRDGSPAEVIALVEDITEQRLAREQLSHDATHDSLTGLANRRFFERILDTSVEAAQAAGTEIAILYIDLDGFKLINDTLGHSAGDALLRQVAERLALCLNDSEFLARMGGDEFTVIQRSLTESEAPAILGRRMLECLREAFVVHGHEVNITASIGISCYPLDGSDGRTLLQSADAAMYRAKRHDSSGIQFFDAKMREAAIRKLTIETQLRRALERHELYVEFQPLYEMSGNTLIRFEALCRWENSLLGTVSPVEFIPAAEEIGLIVDIGNWILEQACIQALRWQEHRGSPIRIAVNVSTLQFADKRYVDNVTETLRATGFPPALLELELTESALLQDQDETFQKMERLRRLGVSLSIDDFGTGYSSLSYLQNLPVDGLKIDRSFIRKLDSSTPAVSMVRSIIAMAHTLGLRVTTEGVETDRQLAMLRQLGADEAQGYFLGRPESAESANQRVSSARLTASSRHTEDLQVLLAAVLPDRVHPGMETTRTVDSQRL